jgi:hypothetical protein
MEAGGKVGVQSGVVAKVAQSEMSQMHGNSIQISMPDARTNKARFSKCV